MDDSDNEASVNPPVVYDPDTIVNFNDSVEVNLNYKGCCCKPNCRNYDQEQECDSDCSESD